MKFLSSKRDIFKKERETQEWGASRDIRNWSGSKGQAPTLRRQESKRKRKIAIDKSGDSRLSLEKKDCKRIS